MRHPWNSDPAGNVGADLYELFIPGGGGARITRNEGKAGRSQFAKRLAE